jgi:hypothetical protein
VYPGGERVVLLGLKTTRKIEPRAFQADAWRMGYHLQWAYYHDAIVTTMGTGAETLVIEIAVENAAPHDVVVYEIPEHVIAAGRRDYRDALRRVLECRERDTWPGHAPDSEVVFEPPSWADCAALDDGFTVGGENAR